MLERPSRSGVDPLELALDKLSDTELGLLQEYRSLLLAGFSVQEIEGMIGESALSAATNAVNKVNAELARMEKPTVRMKIICDI